MASPESSCVYSLAILTDNEECHFSRSSTCLGANIYMCYDHVHLDNLSDISAYQTTTYSNIKCKSVKDTYGLKSCLLSALRKSVYVYDSVVNSILHRTFKIRKV